jgi:RNA polymerase sigma-70 factor, ECF subfamily
MDCASTHRNHELFEEAPESVSGNSQTLDELFAANSTHLYQTAFRILLNPHDAEDAVQDSLLCAFRNLNQFQGRARFSTWLHRIAINSSLMRLRKRKCRREFPLEPVITDNDHVATASDPLSDAPDPEEQCSDIEQREILSEALQKLPDLLRAAIALCDLEGLSTRDAAQRLRVPLSTLKARLFRARRALKATIVRQHSLRLPFRAIDRNARRQTLEGNAATRESARAASRSRLRKSILF